MDWFRWWHGTYDDPKFGLIAQETGIPRASILGLWGALLELASRSENRGAILNLDEEVLSFHLGIDVVTPCNAMKRRGLLHETDGVLHVAKWGERQPKREREDSSVDRVKKHRAKQADKKQTLTDLENHVTPCNASNAQETPRLEEIRLDLREDLRDLTVLSDKPDVVEIFEHWKVTLNHPQAKLDDKRRKTIKAALKLGYTVHELKMAIHGCSLTPHNMGQNDRGERYDELTLILRDAAHIDRFKRNAVVPPRPTPPPSRPPVAEAAYTVITD